MGKSKVLSVWVKLQNHRLKMNTPNTEYRIPHINCVKHWHVINKQKGIK